MHNKHGKGKFFYPNGKIYAGDWINGKIEGFGILYNASGKISYEGKFEKEKFNGKGVQFSEFPEMVFEEMNYKNFSNIYKFWIKYEGDFINNCWSGIGTLYLINGDRFTGRFSNNQINGHGTYFKNSGNPISGKWINNLLICQF